MGALFGDATTAMPTPQTRPESDALMGASSPVPSMDLRRGMNESNFGATSAIPGLDIDPPPVTIVDGKPQYNQSAVGSPSEGVGGWISRMVTRGKDDESIKSGKYKRVGQDGDDEA